MSKIEIAEAQCPSCSPEEPTAHVILRKGGLVKCEECGYVHAVPVKKQKVLRLRVIVSRQDRSSQQELELSEDDVISAGDEFVVEHGDEVSGIRVQSIELKTSGRAERAVARDIETLWARTIDEVIVKVAVQQGAITESINYKINGDHEFVVGDTIRLKGYDAAITSIKVRDGGHLKRAGQVEKAKNIRRIYTKRPREGRSQGRGGGFSLRSRKAYRGTGGEVS
jgi:uncharacterized Zn finger protein